MRILLFGGFYISSLSVLCSALSSFCSECTYQPVPDPQELPPGGNDPPTIKQESIIEILPQGFGLCAGGNNLEVKQIKHIN